MKTLGRRLCLGFKLSRLLVNDKSNPAVVVFGFLCVPFQCVCFLLMLGPVFVCFCVSGIEDFLWDLEHSPLNRPCVCKCEDLFDLKSECFPISVAFG